MRHNGQWKIELRADITLHVQTNQQGLLAELQQLSIDFNETDTRHWRWTKEGH